MQNITPQADINGNINRSSKNKMYTLYKHTNKINGKVYIGITKQRPNRRWMNGLGYQTQSVFYNAIQKYGWNNFEHKIIKSDIKTIEEANELEQYWIKKEHAYIRDPYCNGYNMTIGGDTNQTERLWTNKEEKILEQYYPSEGIDVKKRLENRSKSSIYNRVHILNISYLPTEWTEKELKLLEKTYQEEGIACASRFPGRTKSAIHRKACILGLKHNNKVKWTKDEIDILITNYSDCGLSIIKLLPSKKRSQIVTKVGELNLRFDNRKWTEEEISTLHTYYPSEGLKVSARLKGRSEMSILQKCSELKIKSKTNMRIRCLETGIIYENKVEAARATGDSASAIKQCCCGKQRKAHKYHWEYVRN